METSNTIPSGQVPAEPKAAKPVNSSFSLLNPFLQFAWDSTSLGSFKECERKYYYAVVCGYQTPVEQIDLTFGIHYHALLDHFEKRAAQGQDFTDNQREMVREALSIGVYVPADEELYPHSDPVWQPWDSDHPNKNKRTLIRSVIWYTENTKQDVLSTVKLADGTSATELSFRYELGTKTTYGENILLCGHLDRLVHFGSDIFFLDYKTTKSTINAEYFKRYLMDNQMSNYSVGAKVAFGMPVKGGIVDAVQLAVSFSRFERGFIHRNEENLEEWLDQAQTYINRAQAAAVNAKGLQEIGLDPAGAYLMNDKACFLCHFKDICAKHPKVRGSFLEGNFVKRQWDPLLPR